MGVTSMAKWKFAPGLDAAIERYLDEHHIVARDVRGYTIHRPPGEGVLLLTLECFVHENFLSELEPKSDRLDVSMPGGEPEFIDGAPSAAGEHGPELVDLPAGTEVRRAS